MGIVDLIISEVWFYWLSGVSKETGHLKSLFLISIYALNSETISPSNRLKPSVPTLKKSPLIYKGTRITDVEIAALVLVVVCEDLSPPNVINGV